MKLEKIGFCWNSRKWLIGENPKSCPYNSWQDCVGECGYFEERKPTSYIKRKLELIRELESNKNNYVDKRDGEVCCPSDPFAISRKKYERRKR